MTECDDGLDNDDDGNIDHPADPGCANRLDDDESDDLNYPLVEMGSIMMVMASSTSRVTRAVVPRG